MTKSKTKKPFGQTKIGGVLKGLGSGLLKGAIREIPIIGGLIDNKNSPTGGEGKLVKNELAGQIVVGGLMLLIILESLGVIKTGASSTFKELIESLF